ncbi:MAG: hypothetical protein ACI4CY_07050 [Candidatus Gastranaerophilaceae bacterium]
MKLVDIITLIKELIADDAKMNKFREIVADIKELITDIKDAVKLVKG